MCHSKTMSFPTSYTQNRKIIIKCFCVCYNKLCKYINNKQNIVDVRKFRLVEIYKASVVPGVPNFIVKD